MVASYGYDATGRVTASDGAFPNRFTFVGEHGVEDDGAGLYLMGRRHYDAVTGRFVQRDPVGFAGGMNLYQYAGGNPVGYVDAGGTWALRPEDYELRLPENQEHFRRSRTISDADAGRLCAWALWATEKVVDWTPLATAYKIVKFPINAYYKGLKEAVWDILPANAGDVRDFVNWSGVMEKLGDAASSAKQRAIETFGPYLPTTDMFLRAYGHPYP
jgi:RHS repeat-associated protein